MSVLPETRVLNTSSTRNNRMPFGSLPSDPANRPKAKVWLNVGYEAGGKFINLPIGLPVDTMDAADVRGQNVDWIKQRTAQNTLLEHLKKMGLSMVPGQEQTVHLEVRLRRVNEEIEVADNENEYAIDFNQLLPAAAE